VSYKLEKKIVFLGRLHPKKGVDMLIKAFHYGRLGPDWKLVIAGPNFDPIYGRLLRELVANFNLENQVSFIGSIFGPEKHKLLASSWVVVVPSYSDVVALVNLEAAAVATPTITTIQTGLGDWADSGGLLIDAAIEPLRHALENAADWSLGERQARGAQARAFVQERYSWQAIGPHWAAAYPKIASISRN